MRRVHLAERIGLWKQPSSVCFKSERGRMFMVRFSGATGMADEAGVNRVATAAGFVAAGERVGGARDGEGRQRRGSVIEQDRLRTRSSPITESASVLQEAMRHEREEWFAGLPCKNSTDPDNAPTLRLRDRLCCVGQGSNHRANRKFEFQNWVARRTAAIRRATGRA
jgi:hypothetical protein